MKEDLYRDLKERPSWDIYYMTLAYIVAQRSFDPSSKCGCVLVSKDNRLLSTGYNGPIRGSKDEDVPLTRPDKYSFMIHSEENSLLAYNGSYQDIQKSRAYITGRPCTTCLRMLIQKGIVEVIYGTDSIKMLDDKMMKTEEKMIKGRSDFIIRQMGTSAIQELLRKTDKYIDKKKGN